MDDSGDGMIQPEEFDSSLSTSGSSIAASGASSIPGPSWVRAGGDVGMLVSVGLVAAAVAMVQ